MANLAQMVEALHERHGKTVQIRQPRKFLFFNYTKKLGWLWLKDEGPHWAVWLATGQTTHDRGTGPCVCIEVDKADGHISGAWLQAINMWPVKKNHPDWKWSTERVANHIQITYESLST